MINFQFDLLLAFIYELQIIVKDLNICYFHAVIITIYLFAWIKTSNVFLHSTSKTFIMFKGSWYFC